MEIKEIMREKKHGNKHSSMKVNYEKAIEVNNELKLNVDEQHDDIKHMIEQCDIDDEDEVQAITAARTTMKKNMPVCVTCNQTFAMKNVLKNISRKAN